MVNLGAVALGHLPGQSVPATISIPRNTLRSRSAAPAWWSSRARQLRHRGRRAGLSPLARARPSVLLGQAQTLRPWQFGSPGVPAKTKKPLSVTSNTVPALFAPPLRHSMSPAKTIDDAFRPSSDRDPSLFLAS